MDIIINKYYDGFDGEPEIKFIYNGNDGDRIIIRIWEGFFNRIMNSIKPCQEGWSGLAYYYNMHEGWYDKSPWNISDVNEAIDQLRTIDIDVFDDNTLEVFNDIFDLLLKWKIKGGSIWIAYE